MFESSKSLVSAVSNFESTLGELRHRIVGTLRVGFVDNTISNPDLPLDDIIADDEFAEFLTLAAYDKLEEP